jgi:CBS domain-containing protein
MTSPVVTIRPEDSARAAAETMLRLKISGLPVVDAQGRPVGVVSESDFRFSDEATRKRQGEAWVAILSGGQAMAREYLEVLEREAESVKQIMAYPAISVDAEAGIDEAADLMREKRIKRLVVLRAGIVAGVVTRSDLLKLFAPAAPPPARPVTPEFFESALASRLPPRKQQPAPPAPPGAVTAAELKNLVAEFERKKGSVHDEARRLAREKRDEQVKLLLNSRFTDAELSHVMMLACEAARRGETAVPAMVFPAALCTDGGRAINLPDPGWPATLRGKAADFFLRWERDLKPLGFVLTARMVSFPDGFPGDAELALVWGN